MTPLRIALIGYGAIGADVAKALLSNAIPGAQLVAVMTRTAIALPADVRHTLVRAELLALRPDLVIECAGADAFSEHAAPILRAGVDLTTVSMAALARPQVEREIAALDPANCGRLGFASGAVGALDLLSAAREGGLERVEVIQRKPPAAFGALTAGQTLNEPRIMQQASAREVALALPQNSNVAAAVALAGLGFDRTQVTVIADPAVARNTVEVKALGRFGSFSLHIENQPSPSNPKTSITPAMSLLAAIRRRTAKVVIPA